MSVCPAQEGIKAGAPPHPMLPQRLGSAGTCPGTLVASLQVLQGPEFESKLPVRTGNPKRCKDWCRGLWEEPLSCQHVVPHRLDSPSTCAKPPHLSHHYVGKVGRGSTVFPKVVSKDVYCYYEGNGVVVP